MRKVAFLLGTLCWLLVAGQFVAIGADDVRNHPWYVFLQRDIDPTGRDRLIFVDMLTGEEVELEVYGERYTPLGRSVMFFDTAARRVMLAAPDGSLREHPFLQPGPRDRRVDWVVSRDGGKIAWTLTSADLQNRLITTTWIAKIDGSESSIVLEDGPYSIDVRALPVAFSDDYNTLYMDTHPDGISAFTPFNLYAGIFALDLATGEITPLPDEQPANCLCGADLGRGLFLRLRLTNDLRGFNLHVYNLAGQVNHTIPALQLNNYTSGGNILISPDSRRAVYALARVSNFGSPEQTIQTVFVLVNLDTMTQEALTNPVTTFVHPVEWTEDNSAIIFTSPARDGTWKINLTDRRLERIAEATYIGKLQV